jgi:hypothetical protein
VPRTRLRQLPANENVARECYSCGCVGGGRISDTVSYCDWRISGIELERNAHAYPVAHEWAKFLWLKWG